MDALSKRPRRLARGICLECNEEYHHRAHCPLHPAEQLLDLRDPNVLSFLSQDDIERQQRCDKRWDTALHIIFAAGGVLVLLIIAAINGRDLTLLEANGSDLTSLGGLAVFCGYAGWMAGGMVARATEGLFNWRRYDRWLRYKPAADADLAPEERRAVSHW